MSPDYWGKLLVELADPLEGLLSKNLPMASLNHTTFEFGATKTHPHPIILCCTRARRTNCQQPAPEGIFFFYGTEIILLAHYAFTGKAGEFLPPASVALNQWLVALNTLASHPSLFLVTLGLHGWEGFL